MKVILAKKRIREKGHDGSYFITVYEGGEGMIVMILLPPIGPP